MFSRGAPVLDQVRGWCVVGWSQKSLHRCRWIRHPLGAGPLLSCLNRGGCKKQPSRQAKSKVGLRKKKQGQYELPWGCCRRAPSGTASRDTGFQVAFVRVGIVPGDGWPSPSGAGGAGQCPWEEAAACQRHGLPCHPCWSCFSSQHFTTQHSRVN